jgi:phosphate uptake regulator
MKTQIYDRMRTAEESPVALSHLLIALHDIERVADHAVNIAERVQNLIDQVGADISPVK